MDKQEWLKEAIDYIDSLSTEEFEEFLANCIPVYDVKIEYKDIDFRKTIKVPTASASEAANMDCFYSDNISLAA